VTEPTFGQFLSKWKLGDMMISAELAGRPLRLSSADKAAAWQLYTDIVTQITLQPNPQKSEHAVGELFDVHALFSSARMAIQQQGPECRQFATFAIAFLNHVARPFAGQWYNAFLNNRALFEDSGRRAQFEIDLEEFKVRLSEFRRALADMAGSEDILDAVTVK